MNRNMPDAIRRPARAAGRGRPEAGFTLTELLVVIAVISILAGLIFGAVPRIIERAKITNTRSLIHSIDVGLEAFKNDFGRLPTDDDDGSADVTDDREFIRLWLLGISDNGEPRRPTGPQSSKDVRENQFWSGPYVDVEFSRHLDKENAYVLIDAWREPLCFEMPNSNNDPIFNMDRWDIWSFGADMKGSEDMEDFQNGSYEERRKKYKTHKPNDWDWEYNLDNVGNW